jgi:hypothetical protein
LKKIIAILIMITNLYSFDNNIIIKTMGKENFSCVTPKGFKYKIVSDDIIEIYSEKVILSFGKHFILKNDKIIDNLYLNELHIMKYGKNLDSFVEKELNFKHFKNITSSYVELTDKNLIGKPIVKNDWKYYTRGLIAKNSTFFSFYILTNNQSSPDYLEIIKMLENGHFISKDEVNKTRNN